MVGWLILGIWLLVQPWLKWPSLNPDIGTRLTLVLCALALGVWRLTRPNLVTLPRTWAAWAVALFAVMVWHFRQAIRSGEYFSYFQETALLANGALVALALLWGTWAILQWPPKDLRLIRYVGAFMLIANLVVALWQLHNASVSGWQGNPGPSGLMGMNRFLGTYALAWLPVLWAWRPVSAILPLALIAMSGKPLVCIGALAALFKIVGKRERLVIMVLAPPAVCFLFARTCFDLKVVQRSTTWIHAFKASFLHPWSGWGFSPMTLNTIRQESGYLLANLHSDWLVLAVMAGWVVALSAFCLWLRIVFAKPKTKWARACQASLFGIGLLSFVQGTVSHARIAGLMVVILAWFITEQREGNAHA